MSTGQHGSGNASSCCWLMESFQAPPLTDLGVIAVSSFMTEVMGVHRLGGLIISSSVSIQAAVFNVIFNDPENRKLSCVMIPSGFSDSSQRHLPDIVAVNQWPARLSPS